MCALNMIKIKRFEMYKLGNCVAAETEICFCTFKDWAEVSKVGGNTIYSSTCDNE